MESKNVKRETYRGYISLWETSGQSQREYCALNNINYKTFLYYRKHLSKRPGKLFKEIRLPVAQDASVCLYSIEYPNKCVVRIHEPVGTDFINALTSSCK